MLENATAGDLELFMSLFCFIIREHQVKCYCPDYKTNAKNNHLSYVHFALLSKDVDDVEKLDSSVANAIYSVNEDTKPYVFC